MAEDDRILVFLPLFHANPQMYAVMSVLHIGATMVLLPRFSASGFFTTARETRATGFTYVGTVLSILERSNPGQHTDHGLRWCVGGGAPERVWRAIESRFGVAVRELYGMTETGGWVTMNTADATRVGAVGCARAGVEVRIVEEAGRSVPARSKGEIIARTERLGLFFDGYWKKKEATDATLRDGWLYTGDRGWMDEDGYVYFDSRLKELIRRAGEMISPVEIELSILQHPKVKDCAVVGVPDEVVGEEIKAFIVAHEPFDARELPDYLNGRIPAYMIPRLYAFIQTIPRTETQKIKRHELA
jgi:acyl-CoA synthetase (AMP-forming)/AMP-acid ligase II